MQVSDIIEAVRGYAPNADIDVIMRAYLQSARAHRGQLRKNGEDYLIHPIAVASILTELRMDVDTIAVGLLHDTMEDCLTTRAELSAEFGEDVADMVEGVTKMGKLEFKNKEEAQAENLRKLVLAMARDVRVIIVKLADRLHNMRTMEHMKPARARDIAAETMEIYAPIANRLGLSTWKTELEDHALKYLEPADYAQLNEELEGSRAEREAYVRASAGTLRALFEARGVEATVTGRPKHLTSIWRKMKADGLDLSQVHDVLAFRVVVPDIGQCYVALGCVHAQYRHQPERLKDFIAIPKSNGYQSIHTVVMGPENRRIEVQIRTGEMHRVAEIGIAAHWRYKEGHLAIPPRDLNKMAQLRAIFEAAKEIEDSNEFVDTLKIDLFAEEVFVFTPVGDVRFFPKGATILDFAYAIHTEVGNSCTGARVQGRMVSLRYELHAGDTIEVVRKADQRPRPDWMDIAKTGRAQSKIRRELREAQREVSRELGRGLVEGAFKGSGQGLTRAQRDEKLAAAALHFGMSNVEALLLAVGQGDLSLDKLTLELLPPDPAERQTTSLTRLFGRFRKREESPVLVGGEADLLIHYAACCNPLPGHSIVGYITRGRGITIHRSDCKQLSELEPERRIQVDWHGTARSAHTVDVLVLAQDKPGMLADVSAVCKVLGINLVRFEGHRAPEGDQVIFDLSVNVSHADELEKLVSKLGQVKGVVRAERRLPT